MGLFTKYERIVLVSLKHIHKLIFLHPVKELALTTFLDTNIIG